MKTILVGTVLVAFAFAVPHKVQFNRASRPKISEYITHYEGLYYDTDAVHAQHIRSRRSTDSSQDLRVTFPAFDRTFNLRLRRNLSPFSDDFKVVDSQDRLLDVDMSHIYYGELTDDPNSKVFGSVTDGVFEGKIISQDGSFYVEHERRYSLPNSTRTEPHSVIYKESDVTDPYANRRHEDLESGGLTDEMAQFQHLVDDEPVSSKPSTSTGRVLPRDFHCDRNSLGENNCEHSRSRRAVTNESRKRTTCSLYIQTDPSMWRYIREQIPDNRDPSKKIEVDMKTRQEILSLISNHVMAINHIYGDAKFDGVYEHRNTKFQIQRIKIDDYSACNPIYSNKSRQYCYENMAARNLLHLHSLENHEDFCLAYLFTCRDFSTGVLGLAWLASANGNNGGICDKYRVYTEKIGGIYQSQKHSLNTGIITLLNYNSRVPPTLSHLNFAHQIGHNFGSPDDYQPECRPGGQEGNFLMFGGSISGDLPNNSRFSTCSIGNISQVLDAIEDGRKINCFTSSSGAFCGNKIVEDGEECDCGYDDIECTDRCCYPRVVSAYDIEKNLTAKGCTRRANTQCSPSQGPCCDPLRCQFTSAQVNMTCEEESECNHASYCSGDSAECPKPRNPKADHTKCNRDTQLCINGECSGSMCLAWNMTQCYLSSTVVSDGVPAVIDKRALCQLACQTGPAPESCQSTAAFADKVGLPVGGISLWPGSSCDNYRGYCDVFLRCREVFREVLHEV